jgi:hypothetical protein
MVMNNNLCEACEYLGKPNLADETDKIFDSSGHATRILLCDYHSIELFKQGQRLFLSKYRISNLLALSSKNKVRNLANYFISG